MSDPTLNLELPLDKGTVYTRADGRSAEILSVERDRKEGIKGVNVRITQDGHEPSFAFMHTSDIAIWQLQKPEPAPVGEQHAAPSADDESLTATAQLITDLRAQLAHATTLVDQKNREIEQLIAENAELEETRDSAIEHDAAADDRNTERDEQEREQINLAHKRFDELHEQGEKKYGTGWMTAIIWVNNLAEREYTPVDMYGETDIRVKALLSEAAMTAAAQNSEIATLTEQLAEARLASAPIQSAPAADVTVAPVKEFRIVRGQTEAGLCQDEKNGWEAQHMQFFEDQLCVVYFRYVTPTPVAPEPRASVSVKPVGPSITIQTIQNKLHSIPRLDIQAETENMLTDANAAAQAVVDNAQPFAPRPLQLTGTVAKPEVRS